MKEWYSVFENDQTFSIGLVFIILIEILAGKVPANKILFAGTPEKFKVQQFSHPLKGFVF